MSWPYPQRMSRAIRSAAYDEARNELTVHFASGRGYVYSLVPADVAAAFAASTSQGRFHNEHLRDRYPFRKVRGVATSSGTLRTELEASVGKSAQNRRSDP